MKSVKIDLLEQLADSLTEMIGYADDGALNRNDPDFADFFNKVDQAKKVLEKLCKILEKN